MWDSATGKVGLPLCHGCCPETPGIIATAVAPNHALVLDSRLLNEPVSPSPLQGLAGHAAPFYFPLRALTVEGAPNVLTAGKTIAMSFAANTGAREVKCCKILTDSI